MAYPLSAPLPADHALLLAHSRLGHNEEVVACLESGTPVEVRGLHGTPLIEACRADRCTQLHVLTTQALLARRADVRATDWFGATALIHAALRCSVLPEAHLHRRWPAPGVRTAQPSAAASRVSARYSCGREQADGVGNPGAVREARSRAGSYDLTAAISGKEPLVPGSLSPPGPIPGAGTPQPHHLRLSAVSPALLAAVLASARESEGGTEADGAAVAVPADDADGATSAAAALVASLGEQLQRPRFQSDGRPRHIQLVTLLLNKPRCDVLHRARNGVSAALVLAASPCADAVAVLEWVLERAGVGGVSGPPPPAQPQQQPLAVAATAGAAAGVDADRGTAGVPGALSPRSGAGGPGTGDDGGSSNSEGFTAAAAAAAAAVERDVWAPDAAGANVFHYAAYAANCDALRLLMRLCRHDDDAADDDDDKAAAQQGHQPLLLQQPPPPRQRSSLRSLARAADRFGRTPLDALHLYAEASVLAAPRTQELQRSGLWSEVPVEARRREFRTLLTTLL